VQGFGALISLAQKGLVAKTCAYSVSQSVKSSAFNVIGAPSPHDRVRWSLQFVGQVLQ
jgi:hypothetical protein